MKDNLIKKLHEYIKENNPDVFMKLERDKKITEYLLIKIGSVDALINQSRKGQPDYIIEDACMEVLTQELRPSRYNYILNILEQEFEKIINQLLASGLLQFEAINMIGYCKSVFEDLNFSEANEDNQFTRYAITGALAEYLETVTSENENVSDALQQSTKTEG